MPDEPARDVLNKASTARGVLVDVKVSPFRTPPFAEGWFDIVVIPDLIGGMRPHERVGTLKGAKGDGPAIGLRAPRGGLGALFSARTLDPHYRAHGGAEAALKAEGFQPVRTLAERDGVMFTEGLKPDATA